MDDVVTGKKMYVLGKYVGNKTHTHTEGEIEILVQIMAKKKNP